MPAYYNEIDPQKAAWLRELIREKVIADGEVDERSIAEINPQKLAGFTQCHFFAGIGVMSYALRLAGWSDNRPVWTGSCPCPSFSAAGKGGGFNDPRHLWPDWARLIGECKPATIFGEQADDAIGYGWLDLVQTDLERSNYAVGKAVLGACSVAAPHIRQRLYFVAQSASARFMRDTNGGAICEGEVARSRPSEPQRFCDTGSLAHPESERLREARRSGGRSEERSGDSRESGELAHAQREQLRTRRSAGAESSPREMQRTHRKWERLRDDSGEFSKSNGMGEPIGEGLQRLDGHGADGNESRWFGARPDGPASEAGHVNGFWRDADWILRKRWNRDDWEWCPTEPGTQSMVDGSAEDIQRMRRKNYETFPLACGVKGRVLKLKGYGDAICAPLAAEFIRCYMTI